MDSLFKMGRSLLSNGSSGNGDSNFGSFFDDSGFGSAKMLMKQFDKNGDGRITVEDFILLLKPFGLGMMGESAARMAFKQVDKNGDGVLDVQEAVGALDVVRSLMSMKK